MVRYAPMRKPREGYLKPHYGRRGQTFAALDLGTNNCRMDISTRSKVPCIGKDRADLVIVGCAVLESMCGRWPVGRLRVADRGIRQGILRELMAEADCEVHCGSLDKVGNKQRDIYGA